MSEFGFNCCWKSLEYSVSEPTTIPRGRGGVPAMATRKEENK